MAKSNDEARTRSTPWNTFSFDPSFPALSVPAETLKGNGAADSEKLSCGTNYSTNVPMPDNKGPVKTSGDQGLGVM